MLDEKSWLGISVPVHLKGVGLGLRSGICMGQFFRTRLIQPFMDLAWDTIGAQLCWNRKGPFPNCSHKVRSMQCPKCLGMAGNVFLASAKLSPSPSDYQTDKLDLSLHRINFHCSGVQWWCIFDHSIWCRPLYCVMWGLHAAARPWKAIPWSSCCTVFELTLIPV